MGARAVHGGQWSGITDSNRQSSAWEADVLPLHQCRVTLEHYTSELSTRQPMSRRSWSGRVDLNHRPQRPERCALTKLRHAPYDRIILDCARNDKVLHKLRERG
jgi:hypothetical protein